MRIGILVVRMRDVVVVAQPAPTSTTTQHIVAVMLAAVLVAVQVKTASANLPIVAIATFVARVATASNRHQPDASVVQVAV